MSKRLSFASKFRQRKTTAVDEFGDPSVLPSMKIVTEDVRDHLPHHLSEASFVLSRSTFKQKPWNSLQTEVTQMHAQNTSSTRTSTTELDQSKEKTPPSLNRFHELLTLSPKNLSIQQDLGNCTDTTSVLLTFSRNSTSFNPINLSTAITRLAKITKNDSMILLRDNVKFSALLARLHESIHEMGPVGLTTTLWSLVRLGVNPSWLESDLIPQLLNCVHTLTIRNCSSILVCMWQLQKKLPGSSVVENLKKMTVERVFASRNEITDVSDIISICTTLAKLGIPHKELFTLLSEQVSKNIDSISTEDLASVAWSFAASRTMNSPLITKIKGAMLAKAEECSPRDLITLLWSLSTMGDEDREYLQYSLAPLIRPFLFDFAAKELASVIWSLNNLRISDYNLLSDLFFASVPRVKMMNTMDVTAVFTALADCAYGANCRKVPTVEDHSSSVPSLSQVSMNLQSELFKELKTRAFQISNSLSPFQLARTIHSFCVLTALLEPRRPDTKLFENLLHISNEKRNLFFIKNIVEIISGIGELGKVTTLHADRSSSLSSFLNPLIPIVTKDIDKVSLRDCVIVLNSLAPLSKETDFSKDCKDLLHTILIPRIANSLWKVPTWTPLEQELLDILVSINILKLENVRLMEKILLVLAGCKPEGKNAGLSSFPQILKELGKIVLNSRYMARAISTYISLGEGVTNYFIQGFKEHSKLKTLDDCVNLIYNSSLIGYEDDSTYSILDHIESLENFIPQNLHDQVDLMFGLCQLRLREGISRKLLAVCLTSPESFVGSDPFTLMKLAWCCLYLGEDNQVIADLMTCISSIHNSDDTCVTPLPPPHLPLFLSQQLAIHISTSTQKIPSNTQLDIFIQDILSVQTINEDELRDQMPKVMDSMNPWSAGKRAISSALKKLKIRHKCNIKVNNAYYLPISLPSSVDGKRNTGIDLYGPTDVIQPEGKKVIGTTSVRLRQIASMYNYSIYSFSMMELFPLIKQEANDSIEKMVKDKLLPDDE